MSTATVTNVNEATEATEATEQPVSKVSSAKAQQAVLQEQGKATIADAFDNFTTAVGQAGAGIATAEASAVDFVQGITLLRKAKVTQNRIAKILADKAKEQGVDVPFTSSGYITIAEVVGALIDRGDLGTVTRRVKSLDGKGFDKYEAKAVVRVDGFAGTLVAHDEVEVFGIVRAVVSPQGVPFLAAVGVKEEFYGKDAALAIIAEATDANEALRSLDARASQLKTEISKGKKIAAAEKAAKKAAEKEISSDTLIGDLADTVVQFVTDFGSLVPEGELVAISQASADNLARIITMLQSVQTGTEILAETV